jgi:hypothetical protein
LQKYANDFIRGAPDVSAPTASVETEATRRLMTGKQAQISLAMPLELLATIDEQAARLSI